jgi:hypothetical protein
MKDQSKEPPRANAQLKMDKDKACKKPPRAKDAQLPSSLVNHPQVLNKNA